MTQYRIVHDVCPYSGAWGYYVEVRDFLFWWRIGNGDDAIQYESVDRARAVIEGMKRTAAERIGKHREIVYSE